MDYKITKYRSKHKKCEYCKYCKHQYEEIGFQSYSYSKCILKDKALSFPNLRNLCKYYEVKVEELGWNE